MRGKKIVRMQVIALVCVSLLLPQAVMAAGPAPKVKINDVALTDSGMLAGQIVDQQGIGKAGAQVVVWQQGRKPVQTVADRTGKFQVAGLTGGMAQVATSGSQNIYRVWTAKTAPPAAKPGVLLIDSGQVVRGACGPCCPSDGCCPTSGCCPTGPCGGIGQWVLPAVATSAIIAGVVIATSDTSTTAATISD